MSDRELAAYLIASAMVLAVLIVWRIAALRKRRERRSGYAHIDLVGRGAFPGKTPADDGATTEQQADTDPPDARRRSED